MNPIEDDTDSWLDDAVDVARCIPEGSSLRKNTATVALTRKTMERVNIRFRQRFGQSPSEMRATR